MSELRFIHSENEYTNTIEKKDSNMKGDRAKTWKTICVNVWVLFEDEN